VIAGLILAGGGARRMDGRDKSFLELGGETLIGRTVARLRPQVAALAISANRDPVHFAACNAPVLADAAVAGEGPLAGVLAGLHWARMLSPRPACLVTAAVDTPFFPHDLVARLAAVGGPDTVAAERHGPAGIIPGRR